MSDGADQASGNHRSRFRPHQRVKTRSDFLRLSQASRRVHTPHFVVLLGAREDTSVRLGITVTRKIGGSVQRNRVRRLVREVFRLHPGLFPLGHDVIFIARAGAPELDYGTVLAEVEGARGAMRGAAERNRRSRREERPC